MGLDMYLQGKRTLYTQKDQALAMAIQNHIPELKGILPQPSSPSVVSQVTIEVGYWRKANAIHAWFVKHVQEGVDDCGTYSVRKEQLFCLQTLCAYVLAFPHEGKFLLPTQSGFFFGSVEYDDWYLYDVRNTLEIVKRALMLMEHDWSITYHASW